MFRVLGFLIKLSLLTAAIVWMARHPGKVEIVWQGYLVETSVGFVAALATGFLLLWTLGYRLWRAAVSVPVVFRRYRIAMQREKGYLAVTRGLVAVAAGDALEAQKFARRAENMIPGMALTRLLTAQTALMNGQAPRARREFMQLLEDENAAMFGLRGLLNDTLQTDNYAEALEYARKAYRLQPKRLWVVRTLFDLETRNRDFIKAGETLDRARRLGVFEEKQALAHHQALLTARAEEEMRQGKLPQAIKLADRAFSFNRGFTPAAVLLARLYEQAGKRRAALKTIEKAWVAEPHPELAAIFVRLRPPAKKIRSLYDDGKDLYSFVKPLCDLQPRHHDSQKLLGQAALEARMWREARAHLQQAMDYRALAKLERAETGNEAKAREWLELAADAPPSPKWVCHDCGHAALDWSALCRHCHVFNAYEWTVPNLTLHTPVKKVIGIGGGVAKGFDAGGGLIAPP